MVEALGRSDPAGEGAQLRSIQMSGRARTRSGTRVVLSVVAATLIGFLLLPACGSGSLTEAERVSAEIEIHAAVTRQLVEFDNTFGPHHRFTEVLIVDHLDVDAADSLRQGRSAGPFSEDQRSAIAAAIAHLAPVRFITSQRQFIQQDVLAPVIPGSVIITLGPVEFDGDEATVGANLWCGGVCGLWITYRIGEGPDGWTVIGTEGDWVIS